MTTPTQNGDLGFFSQAINYVIMLLYAIVGSLFWRIEQTKRDAEKTALDVRRELLAAADIERKDRADRQKEHRADMDNVWTKIEANQAMALTQHQRMLDQLVGQTERLSRMPLREDVRADATAMESRIMAAIADKSRAN